MSISLNGVQPRTIDLLPDKSVQWYMHEVPSADGVLYMSPECPESVGELVLAHSKRPAAPWNFLGRGRYGSAFRANDDELGNFAIKRFKGGDYWFPEEDIEGMRALSANIALHEGLERVGPLVVEDAGPDKDETRKYDYSAPEFFAAFLPNPYMYRSRRRLGGKAVWAMELLQGRTAKPHELPEDETVARREYFLSAVKTCGLIGTAINWDDHHKNTRILPPSPGAENVRRRIKFDLQVEYRAGEF
jgi:hypothetical protein